MSVNQDPLLQPLRFAVRLEDARRWATLLGDDNPLHQGAQQVVNPGPANAAYLISFLQQRLPGARLVSFKCRLLAIVAAPGVAVARGQTLRVTQADGVCRVHCTVTLSVGEVTAVAAEAVLESPAGAADAAHD